MSVVRTSVPDTIYSDTVQYTVQQQHSIDRSIDRYQVLLVMEKFSKPPISDQLNQKKGAHKSLRALQRTLLWRKILETLTVVTSQKVRLRVEAGGIKVCAMQTILVRFRPLIT